MSFEPIYIADFNTGLFKPREPWIAPRNAWDVINNASIDKGRVVKRGGFSQFGSASPGDGSPIVGIMSVFNLDGVETLLVANTKRVYEYNAGTQGWNDLSGVDVYTGDDSNFFLGREFGNRFYFTNGKDPVQRYESGTVVNSSVPILTTCQVIMRDRGRLLYMNTTESGSSYPGRVRFSKINDPEAFRYIDDYLDIPTNEPIEAAASLNGEIYVFTRNSIWRLLYLGDSRSPYGWENVPAKNGAISRTAVVEGSRQIWAQHRYGFSVITATGQADQDYQIQDITNKWDWEKARWTHSTIVDDARQAWWTFARTGEDRPQHVIALKWETEQGPYSWSEWDLDVHCFGRFQQQNTIQWDQQQSVPLQDLPAYSFDSRFLSPGYPITLAGTYDGKVLQLGSSQTEDDGVPVDMLCRSMRIQKDRGRRTHLGYMDIYGKASETAEATIRLYRNNAGTPYKTLTVPLAAKNGDLKVRRRILVNCTADFHQFEIQNNDAFQMAIDAIILWAADAGPMGDVVPHPMYQVITPEPAPEYDYVMDGSDTMDGSETMDGVLGT